MLTLRRGKCASMWGAEQNATIHSPVIERNCVNFYRKSGNSFCFE